MVRDVTDQPRLCQEQTLEMPTEGLHRIAEVHLQLLSHGSLLAGLQQTLAMIREQPGHGNQHEVGEQLLLYLTLTGAVESLNLQRLLRDLVQFLNTPARMVDLRQVGDVVVLAVPQGGAQKVGKVVPRK